MSDITKNYIDVKTVLRKGTLAEPYFVTKFACSPYRACQHACMYCDGRAEKYYVDGDFEKDIVIRNKFVEILDKEVSKLRDIGSISFSSGVTDPYQPLEAEEQLIKKSGEMLLNHNLSVYIMTKSALVMRDIDLWDEMNKLNGITLAMSLVYSEDDPRQIFEPGASSVEERLETLRQFKLRDIPVGALTMPFLPYISDSPDQIEELFIKLKNIGIDYIMPGSLTLRPGRQKELYMQKISDHYPNLYKKYIRLYSENRKSGSPLKAYSEKVYKIANELLLKHQIPPFAPHITYRERYSKVDEIYILLYHMQHLYWMRNYDVTPLNKATKLYGNWLYQEKKFFNRHRKMIYTQIDNKFLHLVETGKLNDIINNQKLTGFIQEVLLDKKLLDYKTLKLY